MAEPAAQLGATSGKLESGGIAVELRQLIG
jgi:hypothetical protein